MIHYFQERCYIKQGNWRNEVSQLRHSYLLWYVIYLCYICYLLIASIDFFVISINFDIISPLFCTMHFWLTHWASIVQTFTTVDSFQLQCMQPDLQSMFSCSSLTFFYVFISSSFVFFYCSTFYSSSHLFNHSLLLPLISLSLSLLFYADFFLMLIFLYLFQSSEFRLSVVLFCKKFCGNSFSLFPLQSSWFFYLSSLFFILQHQCDTVYSLFCRLFLFSWILHVGCCVWMFYVVCSCMLYVISLCKVRVVKLLRIFSPSRFKSLIGWPENAKTNGIASCHN